MSFEMEEFGRGYGGAPKTVSRSSRRRCFVRAGALLAVASMLLVACGGSDTTESGESEGSSTTAAAAGPQECSSLDPVSYQIYEGNIINLTAFVAEEQGLFEKYCLEAEPVAIASAPIAFQQSVTGAVDFVSTAPDNVFNARSQGVDVQIVANVFNRLYYALAIGKDTKLPSESEGYPALMQDLVGGTIGVTALGTNTEAIARQNFVAAGLDPDSATYVALGPLPAMLAALDAGTVDAVELFGSGPTLAEALGSASTVVGDLRDPDTKTSEVIQRMTGSTLVWAAQGSFIKENEDVVRRFREANNEAIDWILDPANRDQLIEYVNTHAPFPDSVSAADAQPAQAELVDLFASMTSSEVVNDSLEAWQEFNIEFGGTQKDHIPLDDAVWAGAYED